MVAVASRDRGRAEAYAAEKGIPRAHGSYEDLLADEEVEAVYVPLPNSMHLPWSERALAAGKHVLCEKPLSRRAADVEAAFDAAERAGRILMEGFMWRYHPATEAVARLVAEGAIGALRVVRAAFGFTLGPGRDNVRWAGELEGGALMDVGCYCLSALRLLAGEPERVSAELVEGGDGVDARFAGLLRFGGDVLGTFDCAFDVPVPRRRSRSWGDGHDRLARPVARRVARGAGPARRTPSPRRCRSRPRTRTRCELDDLARAVREGGEPRLGRADAVGQARAIEALYRAAADGGPVTALSRLRRALRAVAVDADLLRRRRELRLLMIGQGVSLLGSAVTLVAIPVQMYDLTGSTVAVGLVGAAQFVPILALALLGGALADAFDRRRLMIAAELGSLAVTRGAEGQRAAARPALWRSTSPPR